MAELTGLTALTLPPPRKVEESSIACARSHVSRLTKRSSAECQALLRGYDSDRFHVSDAGLRIAIKLKKTTQTAAQRFSSLRRMPPALTNDACEDFSHGSPLRNSVLSVKPSKGVVEAMLNSSIGITEKARSISDWLLDAALQRKWSSMMASAKVVPFLCFSCSSDDVLSSHDDI